MGGYLGVNVRYRDQEGKVVETLMQRWTNSIWRTWTKSFLTQGPEFVQYISEATPEGPKANHYCLLKSQVTDQEYGHVFIDFTQQPIKVFSHNDYIEWGNLVATVISDAFLWQIASIYEWLEDNPQNLTDFSCFWPVYNTDFKPWKPKVSHEKNLGGGYPSFGTIPQGEVHTFLKKYGDLLVSPDATDKLIRTPEGKDALTRLQELHTIWEPICLFGTRLTSNVATIDTGMKAPVNLVSKWMKENNWTSLVDPTWQPLEEEE